MRPTPSSFAFGKPASLAHFFCILFLSTIGLRAADAGNIKTRPISLEEAIHLAIENNLALQIERYNPEIDRLAIRTLRGAYDPVFRLSGDQDYRSSPGRLNPDLNIRERTGENWNESFRAGVAGLLPTGLQYDLGTSLVRNSGNITQFTTNGIPFLIDIPSEYSTFAGITLSQPLLRNFWIDGPRANIALARTQLKVSEAALRYQLMLLVSRVEQAYYNLIFSREAVKVQEKALELFERLLADNRRRVEVGTMARLEEKQAESQVATSRADLLAAQRDLAFQENVLKGLLTGDYHQWHDLRLVPEETLIAVPATFDLQDSWARAFANRPDLLQFRLDLERRDIRLRLDHNQRFPQLDVRGSFGLSGVAGDMDPAYGNIRDREFPSHSYGAVLSIPLGNVSARNRYQSSKAEKEQSILRLKNFEQAVLIEVDDALKQAQTSFQRVDATRQARAFAELALDAEQRKFESGRSTSFFVLQYQRDLTAARYQEIRALAEYNNTLAQLALREGTILDRHRLDISVR
jgi:outer membrane protein